jgi:ABC-type uncharacterized transport system substrate-binding protein
MSSPDAARRFLAVTDRRTFLGMLAGGLLSGPLDGKAQPVAKLPRIGYVSTNLAANPQLPEAFRQGLRELGYVEGKTIVVEFRSAEGKLERFPALVSELIAMKVDVIVAANTQAALAAKQATKTIPIVFAGPFDPITSGLVTNLAQPGGNVTGLSASVGPELIGKNLELLKQAMPGVIRIAALWHRDYPDRTQTAILGEAEAAARPLGVRLQLVEAGDPETFDRAFLDMVRMRAEALIVLTSVLIVSSRRRLVDLAARYRLPAGYPIRLFVDEGGLMSYGPLWADIYRRAATHVDKILKGTRPGDLPVEQPTKFELVINVKTAKTLGLTVPPSLLLQANEVIE